MIDTTCELDEVIASEYFRQFENIVRGESKRKCIARFVEVWKASDISSDQSGEKKLESLVKRLRDAGECKEAKPDSLRLQFRSLSVRPLIYCFLSSLVCVLLLQYA